VRAIRQDGVVKVTRRGRVLVAGLVVVVGAACAAWAALAGRARPAVAPPVTLTLPAQRALEARFTGVQFARYRPYRGGHATEAVSLAALAELERHGDPGDLIAALASTGDVARARELAGGLPPDARGDSDRAAIALADGDPERALGHAYRATGRDPALAAAWWNLGVAARARGLARVSRAAFERVVALGEPGWSDEAAAHIAALAAALAPLDEAPAFDARGRAMVDGGALITAADVRRFPAFARVYVLDALRLAAGPRVAPLRPLARALDALGGGSAMAAAADRAAAADPALRARFADRYRAVIARTASPAAIDQLIDALRTAGPAVDDLRVGAIITGGKAAERLDELAAAVAAWHDPWFDLVVARARIQQRYPGGDLRAQPALAAALATYPGDAWALRAGQLAQDLARLLEDSGRPQDAEPWSVRAVEWFGRAVSASHLETARADLGSLHRNLGRTALARAELEEVVLAVGDTSCHLRRFAAVALAALALGAADWGGVRAMLPPAVPPAGCPPASVLQGISTATDLARETGDPRDREAARAWIAETRGEALPDRDGVALIATARLARGADRGAAAAFAAVHAWLASHPATGVPDRIAARTWGFTTLVSDAGGRADWPGVVAVAALEHPATAGAACLVIGNLDDSVLTVVARTAAGAIGDQRRIDLAALATTAIVPPAIARALARCPAIAVDARPPLHGRADILPAALPWWFAGDAPARPAARRGPVGPAIEVASPRSPDTSLPALPPPEPSSAHFDLAIRGDDATPARVLAALAGASYAELHVHGVAAAHSEDAAFLALSPDPDGTFTLSAQRVRRTALHGAPLVVLAACRAAAVAAYLRERWSLPDAFLAAGASAVVAVDVAIPDRAAQGVFDELHRRIDRGESVEAAVAALRAGAAADTAWARHLMVFR
jgi:CHAT domain-containing protein